MQSIDSTPTLPADPTSATSTDTAKIVGGVSAGVVFLLIVVVFLLWQRQHAMGRHGRDAAGESINSFQLGEHSANGSETAESLHNMAAVDISESPMAVSNRNTLISVPSQYRSGSDVFRNMKKGPRKVKSGVQIQEATANAVRNFSSDAESQNAVSSRPTRRTPNILRHLDSGIRMFQMNTRRRSQNREIVDEENGHRSETEDPTAEMIELPPEYSRT
ncbi:hypothetical protein VKT23_012923 [Stygiomarasmius scandens]|uniref:Uncharacterized protein n=1 Tax=Marasmiellus scandens TaxID=2682957 RepID=A0ABR1J7D4_9AGAR